MPLSWIFSVERQFWTHHLAIKPRVHCCPCYATWSQMKIVSFIISCSFPLPYQYRMCINQVGLDDNLVKIEPPNLNSWTPKVFAFPLQRMSEVGWWGPWLMRSQGLPRTEAPPSKSCLWRLHRRVLEMLELETNSLARSNLSHLCSQLIG